MNAEAKLANEAKKELPRRRERNTEHEISVKPVKEVFEKGHRQPSIV